MFTLLTVVHLIIALSLIVFVMLQDSKGGGAFGMGGGSATQGIFGASGAGNFLVTGTKWLATLFAVTCLALSYLTVANDSSITEGYQAPAAAAVPATETPATAAPAAADQKPSEDAKK